MKISNHIKSLLLIGVLTFAYSCSDLEVENLNDPNISQIVGTESGLEALISGTIVDLMWTTLTFRNVSFDLQADLITSTNAFSNYWGDADEPRRRIDNTTTFDDKENYEYMWSGCNAAVSVANSVIGFGDSPDDFSDGGKGLAAAYWMKGVGQGYISYVYDQGFIVNSDSDVDALSLVPYSDMLTEAIANLERAIAIYEANDALAFDYITDSSLSSAEMIALCHTYAARFIAGNARTGAERAATDWAAVKRHAELGIENDWNPTSDDTNAGIYNGQHSWNTFVIDGDGACYMPLDLQVTHLADPSSPATFPLDPGAILDPITTDDQRYGLFSDGTLHDFEYTPSIGWLRADRNQSIFSNYTFQRFAYDYANSNDGNPMHIVTAYENQLLLAEAELHLGNNAACKAILDSGERVVRGGLPALADDSFDTLEKAIHYENVVGLHSSGSAIGLAYMRRWDRLQEGSYLNLPVPASELEVQGLPLYTFGGAGNGSEVGTADGSNAWK